MVMFDYRYFQGLNIILLPHLQTQCQSYHVVVLQKGMYIPANI